MAKTQTQPQPSATKTVLVQRAGETIAVLRFGQPPQVKENAEGRTLVRTLAMQRFVYDPKTRQMAVYPGDDRFRTSPYWWLLGVSEATWPKYTLVPTKGK